MKGEAGEHAPLVVMDWTSHMKKCILSSVVILSLLCGADPSQMDAQATNNNNNRDHYSPSSHSSSSGAENKPIIKSPNQNITVGPGERAVMKCRIENLGTKTVTWRKESDIHPLTIGAFPFAPDSRMSVDHNGRYNEWSFIIHDVKPSDEGVYHCQISTKNGNYSQAIRLNVKTIRVTGLEYVEKGSTIQLTCNVTGKPDPPNNIDWFMGSRKVEADASRGIIITKKIETRVLVSMLTIKNSQPSDTGLYTCTSSEEESSSISVHVLNVPSPEAERIDPMTNERLTNGFFFKSDSRSTPPPPLSIFALVLFVIVRLHVSNSPLAIGCTR